MKRHFVDMPDSFARLPVDARGFPVPKFVQWFDGTTATEPGVGQPDFRVIDSRHMKLCVERDVCWLCGGKLGRYKAFVTGPMCAVNRINSEPPSHYVCSRFAARNCPFLTRPMAKRNDRDLPVERTAVGIPIDRNPGLCCIWVTAFYKPFRPHAGGKGTMFRLGPPDRVEFWCEGRPATRWEVEESVGSGLPILLETATRYDGPEGIKELQRLTYEFNKLLDATLPKEATT